jgi:hypothetical protein
VLHCVVTCSAHTLKVWRTLWYRSLLAMRAIIPSRERQEAACLTWLLLNEPPFEESSVEAAPSWPTSGGYSDGQDPDSRKPQLHSCFLLYPCQVWLLAGKEVVLAKRVLNNTGCGTKNVRSRKEPLQILYEKPRLMVVTHSLAV